jgi:hypothetical protein
LLVFVGAGFNFQYTSTHEITIGKQVCSGPAVGGHVCKPGQVPPTPVDAEISSGTCSSRHGLHCCALQANGKELGWALGAMIAHMGAPVPAAGRADL